MSAAPGERGGLANGQGADAAPPLELHRIAASLEPKDWSPPGRLPWLEESREDPARFHAALVAAHAGRLSGPLRSDPPSRIALYADAVLAHARRDAVALRYVDPDGGPQALTYPELDARASAAALAWSEQGVAPGATVALALEMGPWLAVGLLAALRIGAVASIVSLEGADRLAARLKALAPDALALDPERGRTIPGCEAPILSWERRGRRPADAEAPHVYGGGSPCVRAFSPLAARPDTPRTLTAAEVYLGALRDARIALALDAGVSLAAPGLSSRRAQPALLLSTLLVGGTYVHLEPGDVSANPGSLAAAQVDVLIVTPAVREVLRGASACARVRAWFRDPLASADLESWRSFPADAGLEGARSGNVSFDAASGGALLFSARRAKGQVSQSVMPAAGEVFSLEPVGGGPSGRGEAGPGAGALARWPAGAKKPLLTPILLAAVGVEHAAIGFAEARREGHTVLAEEVAAVASRLPFVIHAALVAVPTPAAPRSHRFDLLAFIGPCTDEDLLARADGLRRAVVREVEARLGRDQVPDRVEIVPGYARLDVKGGVDRAWCASQHLTGSLARKLERRSYSLLTRLRAHALAGAPKAPRTSSSAAHR